LSQGDSGFTWTHLVFYAATGADNLPHFKAALKGDGEGQAFDLALILWRDRHETSSPAQ
jgi:hypothetical protein